MTSEEIQAKMTQALGDATYFRIRRDIIEALCRYAYARIPTGHFLCAVLENNLMEAVGRADEDGQRTLPDIARFIYNELPAPCHGSPQKVRTWLAGEGA